MISMTQKTQQPGIKVMQTPKGLLVQGFLPEVQDLEVEILDDIVLFSGETPYGPFQEELILQQEIDTKNTITTYHDYQLRMVMPWRNTP